MVTTAAPAHPLRAGMTPAILWTALLLVNLLTPLLVCGVALPTFARLQNAPERFLPTVLITIASALAFRIFAEWAWRELRMRTPGAMRTYSVADPDAGPRAADLLATTLRGLALTAAVLLAVAAVDATDRTATSVMLLALGIIGGYLFLAGAWEVFTTVGTRLPGWHRELLFPLLNGLLPAVVATVPLITTPVPDARAVGWCFWAIALAFTFCLRVATRWPITKTERAMVTGVRQDAADLTETITTLILSRTNPAPTLHDRHQLARKVRSGLWATGIIVGLGLLLALFG